MRAYHFIDEALRKLVKTDTTRADAWINKVYAQFQPHPLNFDQRIMVMGGEGEEQKFAMFELEPSKLRTDTVELKWLSAYPQRQGVGLWALRILQDLAAKDGISLTLYPWDKGNVSQSKLMKFYRKAGFKPTKKGSKNMYWNGVINEGIDSDENILGPFKVVQFDEQTKVVTLANGARIVLAANVKDVPKPGRNYAFDLDGNVAFKIVLLTVDNVIIADDEVLLIKRKNDPFKDHWALPGGFIDPGETAEQAAYRELEEETGLKLVGSLKFIGKFDTPHRDPRMADTWSYAFATRTSKKDVEAKDDATAAEWIPIEKLAYINLAFDHKDIIKKALDK